MSFIIESTRTANESTATAKPSPMEVHFSGEQVPRPGDYRPVCGHTGKQSFEKGSLFPECSGCGGLVGWTWVQRIYSKSQRVPEDGSYRTICKDLVTQSLKQEESFGECHHCKQSMWVQV